MRLQYFLYDRFRIAYLLGVEVKHIISEIGLREITGGQSSNEDQGHSSAKVVSSPLVDKGACVPRWTSAGVHWAFLVFVWSATWYTAGCPPPPRSGCPARCRPCFLRFVAQYLYNIHMRWLQYLRVRNSKYIRFKGLDNSRLHVAGRDNQTVFFH